MNFFEQRKKDILNKKDKSSIGEWDEKIIPLCDKINGKENFYTTSSCSGRILILKDEDKKQKGLFEFVTHNLLNVDFEKFLKYIHKENAKLDLKFKQEPFILHIACKDLDDAKTFLKLAQKAGIKQKGIISIGKRIVVEIKGSEKIEFPLTKKGKVLINEEFFNEVMKKANKNLKKSWEKIEKLGKNFN